MPQWKQFSGNWTVTQQVQAKGAGTWPGIPGAPTIGTATGGNGEATVAFTAPANPGYPTTLTYEVTSSPGSITASGSASPITVTGLTNGTEYTFTVTATNDTGTGPASAASNAVTPIATGGVWVWGTQSASDQLGLGAGYPSISSPVQIPSITNWVELSINKNHTIARRENGTIYVWGFNGNGELGLNNRTATKSPTQLGSLTTWTQVTAGGFGQGAIKNDGTLWLWGSNLYGQLGQNNTIFRSSPVQVGSDTDWATIMGGNSYAFFALKTDGTLWAWGRDEDGTMAQSTVNVHRSSPTQIGALTTWASLLPGGTNGGGGAIKTDGTLWMWGPNYDGNLGTNNTVYYSSPVQVGSDTDWSLGSSGYACTAAIKTNGTLWIWGGNTRGQLGQNDTYVSRSSPIQVGSLTGWTQVNIDGAGDRVGGVYDGKLYTWGRNSGGGLGLGDLVWRSSPTQVGSRVDWFEVELSEDWGGALGPTS